MTKQVHLNIINNTPFDFTDPQVWWGLNSAGLASGSSWPATIPANTSAQIACEGTLLSPSISGWVNYTSQGKKLYFCFSNPMLGSNGIALGLKSSTWDSMSGKYDNGITVPLSINDSNLWVVGHISNTGGDDNQATWDVKHIDLNQVTLANIEMDDVITAFRDISINGERQYYECDNSPTPYTGIFASHFKGISTFAEKVIFSSPDLDFPSATNGKYVVADKITVSNQGTTELTADTKHQGWVHPCSSQACGSFMALGIQESADNPSKTSQIEIYDIRKAQINQEITLLGFIDRPDDGVNGIAMTREHSGTYLVGGVNGNHLKVYRSSTTDLLGAFPSFTVVIDDDSFPESGAGLALITQTNGDIYIMALNADDDATNNRLALFKLNFVTKKADQVGVNKTMNIPGISDTVTILQAYSAAIIISYPLMGAALEAVLTLGRTFLSNSFRWGKGVNIKNSTTFELYASDRNVIPLSSMPLAKLPLISTKKDFSLLTWETKKRWPTAGQTLGITINQVKDAKFTQYFLTAVGGGGKTNAGAAVITTSTVVGPNEKFTIEVIDAVHGYFALKTANGNYLTAVGSGGMAGDSPLNTDKITGGKNEKFTLEAQPDDCQIFALKTANGNYLTAVGGGGVHDLTQPINTNATAITATETFGLAVIN